MIYQFEEKVDNLSQSENPEQMQERMIEVESWPISEIGKQSSEEAGTKSSIDIVMARVQMKFSLVRLYYAIE